MSQIISIEGNIGSGKSTLLTSIKNSCNNDSNIIFLQEPVEEWESIKDNDGVTILKKFYENQKKYSFAFQMMAYISRLNLLKETIEKYPNAIIITERCLNTDRYVFAKMLYDSGKMEDIEYKIYSKWFDSFSTIQDCQKTIYLKTDPHICMERICKRERDGESNIPLEYLIDCDKYHDEMINSINKDKLLVINSNVDTDKDKNINNIWIENIRKFIY